jgi:hypothetical protein
MLQGIKSEMTSSPESQSSSISLYLVKNNLLLVGTMLLSTLPSLMPVPPHLQHLFATHPTLTASFVYMVAANYIYLTRRAQIRQETKITMLNYRIVREEGVSIPMHLIFLSVWQTFVALFPLVELISTHVFDYCCLFYSYPKANGCGILWEPIKVQHLPLNQRSKHQIRLDWHRFSINVGPIGRDGYRHPPSRQVNLPHLDIPQMGMKHWPWKKRRKIPSNNNDNNNNQNIIKS